MKAHRNLLDLRKKMLIAVDNHDVHVNYDGVSLVVLLWFTGLLSSLTVVAFYFDALLGSLGIVITCLIIGAYVHALIHRKKKTKLLTAEMWAAVELYQGNVHEALKADGYQGEFVAQNDPREFEYRIFAEKKGKVVTVTVAPCADGMTFTVAGKVQKRTISCMNPKRVPLSRH